MSLQPDKAIVSWYVAGADRLVGVLWTAHGALTEGWPIITSPVASIQFRGDPLRPVVVTTSGTEYWLGPPSSRADYSDLMKFSVENSPGRDAWADFPK
jgi:hypothetical protein